MSITLRDATAQDEQFLVEVYASTRAAELAMVPWTDEQKTVFVKFQFDAQDSYYRAQFPAAQFQIIMNDGEPVGRLYVLREDEQIRILDITIAPNRRGGGVGSSVIGELLNEATDTQRSLTIWVEKDNPSQSLFRRKGFLVTQEDGFNQLLEFRALAQNMTM
jgi:N-acetylglutamate synthase-like GNAT family acetyltransferase